MLSMCFLKNKRKQNDYEKKEKSLTQQESNPRLLKCKGNTLLRHTGIMLTPLVNLIVFNIFVPTR